MYTSDPDHPDTTPWVWNPKKLLGEEEDAGIITASFDSDYGKREHRFRQEITSAVPSQTPEPQPQPPPDTDSSSSGKKHKHKLVAALLQIVADDTVVSSLARLFRRYAPAAV